MDADVLRSITAPVTVNALKAGADALDEAPRLHATIAGLETTRDQLAAENAELRRRLDEAKPKAQFPGDPGPGKILVGCATSGNGDPSAHEKAAGVPVGVRRRYWRKGPSDLAVPNGPVARAVLEDHAAGRIPLVSVKPGPFADTAAGKFDAQFTAFFTWLETLPDVTFVIVNHEPENDGTPAADFRAAQQHIRSLLDKAAGGTPKRVSFGGSLMTYTWNPVARRNPDDWFPGPGVWDWCGLDHYAAKAGSPVENSTWAAAVASLRKWGVRLAVAELGIRDEDPTGGTKLKAFYEKLLSLGAAFLCYYDSDVNSTGTGWEMSDAHGLRSTFRELLADPRTVRPADL